MENDLIIVAKTIRPYLSTLAKEQAIEYDKKIAHLLEERGRGKNINEALSELFSSSPKMQNWTDKVRQDPLHRPPELQEQPLGNIGPYRGGMPVNAQKYECPVDRNYVWWRQRVGDFVPQCPNHHVPLIPA